MAFANPFGLLPDAVLLLIFREGCDEPTQQAAYKSCKDIRDFCHRNMKLVTVDLSSSKFSSTTMCPQAAYGVERLRICSAQDGERHTHSCLRQLINDAFGDPSNLAYRAKQLANINTLELQLPLSDGMTADQRKTVARLVSQFPKLCSLDIDVSEPLAWLYVTYLQQLVCRGAVTQQELQLFANQHPNIQRLKISIATQFDFIQPQLLRLPALKHLHLGPAYDTSMRMSVRLLAELTQLSTLALDYFVISHAHLLRKLHITQLTLKKVKVDLKEQQLPPLDTWPALKSVKFMGSSITETLARAILPLPHPGVTVTWPDYIIYHTDVSSDPQVGYMAVAHMRAVNQMSLKGLHNKAALQAMVRHRAHVRELYVYEGPLNLGQGDAAACLALPTLRVLRLYTLVADTPQELFGQLFQQCPLLEVVIVRNSCVPADMQLPPLVDAVFDGHNTVLCREHVRFWSGISSVVLAARRGIHK